MRQTILPILTIALLAVVSSASAQGLYTEQGFGGELGFQSGDHTSNVGVALGYAVNRIFEAGIGIERESYDGSDGNKTYFTPRVRGYFMRQGESTPVTVYGEGHYHFVSVSDAPDGYSESGWGIGAGAARSFMAGDVLSITPIGSVMYSGYTYGFDGDEFTSNPFLITVAVYGSAAVGPGTLYGGPVFYTETGDGESFSQFGLRLGMVVDR